MTDYNCLSVLLLSMIMYELKYRSYQILPNCHHQRSKYTINLKFQNMNQIVKVHTFSGYFFFEPCTEMYKGILNINLAHSIGFRSFGLAKVRYLTHTLLRTYHSKSTDVR